MKIGILQTGHAPDEIQAKLGDFDAMFGRLLADAGLKFQTFNVVDMDFPDNVNTCDGWLVTGSRHGAYEDHAFIPPLEDFIRNARTADVPMVGICFGHQIIAQALGGEVVKFDGGWAVGRQSYKWGDTEIALNAWHQDQVVALPDGARAVACNDFCENAAVVYGNQAFTVQPHPEFGDEVIDGLARIKGPGVVPDPLLEQVQANMGKDNANDQLSAMIIQFFRERTIA
ncbi:MAG: type 1 glutamine amidotransferase [Yoonia sp.]|nr:type 1 glutamine amidotransferase [Yoonia sp.]MDG1868782.1 type 1 glutamine amidotransferase [Yoonia sp.]